MERKSKGLEGREREWSLGNKKKEKKLTRYQFP